MSAAYIVLVGEMTKADGTKEPVTIAGMADIINFVPGSPPPRPHPEPPLGIWGPNDPRPTPPIELPPGYGRPPVHIWGGGNAPFPTPPISLPGLPGWEPKPPGGGGDGDRPKLPLEAKVAWTPETGWIVVFVPTDEATLPTPSK